MSAVAKTIAKPAYVINANDGKSVKPIHEIAIETIITAIKKQINAEKEIAIVKATIKNIIAINKQKNIKDPCILCPIFKLLYY